MALTRFQVLDKAVELGGTNLAGKDIAGSAKKAADAILAELCSAELLEKGTGRSPKYSLTAKGRAAWEAEASPERKHQLEKVKLVALLTTIEKKQGKPFSEKEHDRLPAALLNIARERKLIELGAKDRSYRLLPGGEELLQAEQPFEQQLKRLREQQKKTLTEWQGSQRRLQQEVEELAGKGLQSIQEAARELMGRAEQAVQTFNAALTELGAFSGFASAARQLQASTEEACSKARQRLEEEKTGLSELEARLKRSMQEQREQMEALERRIGERLDAIAARIASGGADTAEPPVKANGATLPSEATIWEATHKAYEELKQETFRIGGIVKVPELTDRVRRAIADLSPSAFHDLLQRWQQEDRLTLQLCNDPRLESRAQEGIRSPRGLLFYIQMR